MIQISDTWTAFDFETSGTLPEYALQPWRVAQGTAWVTSLAIVDGLGNVSGGLKPTKVMMAEFLRAAIDNDSRIVGWNTPFDISWLLAYGLHDLVFKAKWLDGMLLWRHLRGEPEYNLTGAKKKSYSLKSFVSDMWPHRAGYQMEVDFHDEGDEARERLHNYNIKDTRYTLDAARILWDQLSAEQRRAALIEAECLPMTAAANLQGLRIDLLSAAELAQKLADDAEVPRGALAMFGVTDEVVRSPTKLAAVLYDEWKLPMLKTTATGSRSTDKEVLHELALFDERAKMLRDYREAMNNKTKFADALIESAAYNEDGCAHPTANVFGTYSGRLTYSSKQGKGKDERPIGFALHQEKNDPIFRALVVPPDGYDLLEFDASGQEFRWMAIASCDQTMLTLCMPGEDPHSYMGSRISGVDYYDLMRLVHEDDKQAKDRRKLGKVGNLSCQYRTSAKKLLVVSRVQYGIPMELLQATQIHAAYRQTYPGVPRYWANSIERVKQCGYAETFAGRRVRVTGDWKGPTGWSMESTAINYPIQGTGAEQKYLALACIKAYLTSVGAYFAWDLHDGIYLYVPTAKTRQIAAELKRRLDNLPYARAWGFTPPIPLPWDVKIGPSWGQLKEWKE